MRSVPCEKWKDEIEIWKLVTELKPEKLTPAVSLPLSGNAREIAMEVKAADLGKDTGMKTLIDHLDKMFLGDDKDKAH